MELIAVGSVGNAKNYMVSILKLGCLILSGLGVTFLYKLIFFIKPLFLIDSLLYIYYKLALLIFHIFQLYISIISVCLILAP
jgi:hypothetical protein